VAVDVSTIVSLIGALGLGSVLGQWIGAGKDRRTARAAVLKEHAVVENARWYQEDAAADTTRLEEAIRALELLLSSRECPGRQFSHMCSWLWRGYGPCTTRSKVTNKVPNG
jgi:hypothetical protein